MFAQCALKSTLGKQKNKKISEKGKRTTRGEGVTDKNASANINFYF